MLGDPDADYVNANYVDVSAAPVLASLLTFPACPCSLSRQGTW